MSEPRVLRPTPDAIARAAEALRAGRLVVFPTETVYGLGAHALDPDAVRRVFAAKGRPADNPLIVHVADTASARALTRDWPEEAQRLADAFWPGPLTLVLPRDEKVPDVTTGGLDTVALRVPDHPIARALLAEVRLPLAAPSANVSGRPSPTRVEDAHADLGDSVECYLDGGATRVGVESTVVGLHEGRWTLLRSGGVPTEEIERVLRAPLARASTSVALAPGMKYRHYAPRARVVIAKPSKDELNATVTALRSEGHRVALVASKEHAPVGPHVRVPGSRTDGAAWAAALFSLLRDLDDEGYDVIVVESVPEAGLGLAVMERLRKAAE